MGLGSTAKKLQTLADRAEQLYAQLKDLRERVMGLEESVEETSRRVDHLENDSEKQLVLLKELAREQDIDVESVLAEAAIDEAEGTDASTADDPEDAEADASAEASDGAEQSASADEAAGS